MIKAAAEPLHRSTWVCVFHPSLGWTRTTIHLVQYWTAMSTMLCFSTTQRVLVYKQNCNLHINKISNWSKTWLTCLFLVRPCLGGHLCPRPPSFTGTGNTADCLEVDSLPTLNATSKNIRQECSAWQRGKVGGPWFVATLKAYFDTTAPFECNLRLFLCYPRCLSLSLYSSLCLGTLQGSFEMTLDLRGTG